MKRCARHGTLYDDHCPQCLEQDQLPVPERKPRAARGTFDRAKYHKEYMRKYMKTYLPKWRARRRKATA
jgi:hypothetical protein